MTNQADIQPKKMGSFKRSLELTKSSWQVLRLEKNFLSIPLVGILLEVLLLALAALILAGIAFGILALNGHNTKFLIDPHNQEQAKVAWQIIGYLLFFVLLLITFFVYSLVYGSIVHGASERFKGNDPTLKSCFAAAYKKKRPLFLFSLFSATIGTILQYFEDKNNWAVDIAVGIIGAAWSLGSLFAVPSIMASEKPIGPIDATKDSVKLVKKVWGETILVNGGVGIAGALVWSAYSLFLTGIALVFGYFGLNNKYFLILLFLFIAGTLFIVLLFSVLGNIARAAIFYWATSGNEPSYFNKKTLQTSIEIINNK